MDGEGARAVVRVGAEKKNIRAQIGDDIGGWMVSQIEGRRLVLSLDGRFATFTLFNREVGERTADEGIASQVPDRPANARQLSQSQQHSSPANENAGTPRKRRRKPECRPRKRCVKIITRKMIFGSPHMTRQSPHKVHR